MKSTVFFKSIVYVLLVGQLFANTLSHCYWMVDGDVELIELCNSEDHESEEEDKKKNKNENLQIDLAFSKLDQLSATGKILYLKGFLSLHHPETSTPPPEYISELS